MTMRTDWKPRDDYERDSLKTYTDEHDRLANDPKVSEADFNRGNDRAWRAHTSRIRRHRANKGDTLAQRGLAIRYHLEDQGQDLHWLVIRDGNVLTGGPFQGGLYAGWLNYDYYAEKTLKVGDRIRVSRSVNDEIVTLKYPIERIERVDETPAHMVAHYEALEGKIE